MSRDDDFPRVRLRFFRELNRVQRLKMLVDLGGFPQNFKGFPTMAVERKALEVLRSLKKLAELEIAIEKERSATAIE